MPKSFDGTVRVRFRPPARFDWDTLEREFILNSSYPSAYTWLQEAKGWPRERVYNGNTRKRIAGWSTKRGQYQSIVTKENLANYKKLQQENLPAILHAKLIIIQNIVKDVGGWNKLNAKDKKLCYDIIKNELGEPTNTTKYQHEGGDKPIPILGAILNVPANNGADGNISAKKTN